MPTQNETRHSVALAHGELRGVLHALGLMRPTATDVDRLDALAQRFIDAAPEETTLPWSYASGIEAADRDAAKRATLESVADHVAGTAVDGDWVNGKEVERENDWLFSRLYELVHTARDAIDHPGYPQPEVEHPVTAP